MDRQKHIAVWLRMLAVKEVRLSRQANSTFKKQARQAAKAYQEIGLSEAEHVIKRGFADWYKLLTTHYTITTKDFIAYTFDQLGVTRKSTFQDVVQRYISQNALKKSALITGRTADLMRGSILKGQQEGLGEVEIAKNIRESISGPMGESRSRTIARTEIHDAATYGMQAAAEETELKLIREWVTVHDERTREAHDEADGQERGMDEPFEVGDELIDRPGEGSPENSINCRCTVIYSPK